LSQSKLLNHLTDAIRAKHYSIRTEQAYVSWVKNYIRFHNKKDPITMGENDISDYLTFLTVKKKVAASTQNQALSAILFLYRDVLEVYLSKSDNIHRSRQSAKLPVVFTKDGVNSLSYKY
jgi:site-specific recombinase XerD